jgi:hypothetical protein
MGKLVHAVAVGEQAVVPDAMEAIGQDMQQEATHKLADAEAHRLGLLSTSLAIILPAEADMVVVEVEQPTVADGNTMRVPGKIGEHLSRPRKRTLGVDDALDLAQRRQISPERILVVQLGEIREELELTGCIKSRSGTAFKKRTISSRVSTAGKVSSLRA